MIYVTRKYAYGYTNGRKDEKNCWAVVPVESGNALNPSNPPVYGAPVSWHGSKSKAEVAARNLRCGVEGA